MGKKQLGKEKIDRFVGVMLTQTQYDLVAKDALASGTPLSMYIRHLIANAKK